MSGLSVDYMHVYILGKKATENFKKTKKTITIEKKTIFHSL